MKKGDVQAYTSLCFWFSFFFFSSRRRHTRLQGDWSSDVCSSDLSFARHFRTDKIDLRETVYVFPRQNVITKDNVVVEIDALIYSQITDPVRATYEIANLPDAIEKLTQTTLRNVIGEMELDHVLSSRDTIN